MKHATALVAIALIAINLPAHAAWEPQLPGIDSPNFLVWSMAALDGGVVWAVADSVPTIGTPKIVRTTDGGATWSVHIIPGTAGFELLDISALDQDTAWVTANNWVGSGGIFKTTDGGESWVQQFTGPGLWVVFFNAQDGVSVNRHLIHTTIDGGGEWELVPPENRPPYLPGEGNGIFSGNNSRANVGDTIWVGTTRGRVFRSEDRGHHWSVFETSLGPDACINGIAFLDADNGLVCSCLDSNWTFSPNQLARTTDGGETWTTLVAPTFIRAASITDRPGPGGGYLMVSATPTLHGSAYTYDNGMSWSELGTERLTTADFADDIDIGWAGGYTQPPNNGGIYRWCPTCSINEEPTSNVGRSFSLSQNYPNPFNPTTTIEFSMPRRSQVVLRIYNVLGQEITTLLDETRDAGIHTTPWDPSNVASGVYFYRVEADGWTVTRAMTLAR